MGQGPSAGVPWPLSVDSAPERTRASSQPDDYLLLVCAGDGVLVDGSGVAKLRPVALHVENGRRSSEELGGADWKWNEMANMARIWSGYKYGHDICGVEVGRSDVVDAFGLPKSVQYMGWVLEVLDNPDVWAGFEDLIR